MGDAEANLVREKVGWRASCHGILKLLKESTKHGIRSKMVPKTPVRQQKGNKGRAVAAFPIFMEILTGDDAPSELRHQAGLSLGRGNDMANKIGQRFRDLG